MGWGEWARPKREGFLVLKWKQQEGVLVAVVEIAMEMAWATTMFGIGSDNCCCSIACLLMERDKQLLCNGKRGFIIVKELLK